MPNLWKRPHDIIKNLGASNNGASAKNIVAFAQRLLELNRTGGLLRVTPFAARLSLANAKSREVIYNSIIQSEREWHLKVLPSSTLPSQDREAPGP